MEGNRERILGIIEIHSLRACRTGLSRDDGEVDIRDRLRVEAVLS